MLVLINPLRKVHPFLSPEQRKGNSASLLPSNHTILLGAEESFLPLLLSFAVSESIANGCEGFTELTGCKGRNFPNPSCKAVLMLPCADGSCRTPCLTPELAVPVQQIPEHQSCMSCAVLPASPGSQLRSPGRRRQRTASAWGYTAPHQAPSPQTAQGPEDSPRDPRWGQNTPQGSVRCPLTAAFELRSACGVQALQRNIAWSGGCSHSLGDESSTATASVLRRQQAGLRCWLLERPHQPLSLPVSLGPFQQSWGPVWLLSSLRVGIQRWL